MPKNNNEVGMPEVTNAANNTFQPKNILLNEVQCVSFSSFTLLTTYFLNIAL
jgi:hypothetical protein